jgi:hypothetical protein
MWRVLGTIAPTRLHIAQIHHNLRHTLNAGTPRHTTYAISSFPYPPLPSQEPTRPSQEPIRRRLSFPGYSGRKAIIGQRLKQSRMHWTAIVAGLNDLEPR